MTFGGRVLLMMMNSEAVWLSKVSAGGVIWVGCMVWYGMVWLYGWVVPSCFL